MRALPRRNVVLVVGGVALVGMGTTGLLLAACVSDPPSDGLVILEGGTDVITIHDEAAAPDSSVYIYSDGSVGQCGDSSIGTANIFPCKHGETYCLQAMNCSDQNGGMCGNDTSGQPIARIQCNVQQDCNPLPSSADASDDAGDADPDAGAQTAAMRCCASVQITDAGHCPVGIAPNNPGNITNCADTCESSQFIVCTANGNECPAGMTCRPGLSDFGGFHVEFGFCY